MRSIGICSFRLGFGYNALTTTTAGTNIFVFLYCLTNFFLNFGPNVRLFICLVAA
jgi:MFS transporter, PHS family, inorganic phosphate transporter